jgi:prolyl 4-hydroxylase
MSTGINMRPHIINDKKNFISGWYIDENLCDSIVEACSGRNRLKFNGRLKSSFNGYLFSQIKTLSEQLHVQYISELTKVVDLYKKEYPFLNNEMENFEIEKFEQTEFVQLQMYDPKFSYSRLHCENNGGPDFIKRCLVFMTYLNDVDDGGGTDFPYQNISTKAEKGLTLIWPAYWTHPHQGIVSETQKKIIATGWYTFQ